MTLELTSGGSVSSWSDGASPDVTPGGLRLFAWQSFAAGANAVAHFSWRTFPKGAEQLESAILPLDGVPGRKYFEMKEAGAEFARIGPLIEQTKVASEVGIVWSYDSLWALAVKPISRDMSYPTVVHALYQAATASGEIADIIAPNADLRQYKAIILPAMVVMDSTFASRIADYVRSGGTVIATFLTATKDSDNCGYTDGPRPAHMTEIFGAKVVESDIATERSVGTVEVAVVDKVRTTATSGWVDQLELLGARAIATVRGGWRDGQTVASMNNFGNGAAYYLGTLLDSESLANVVGSTLQQANVRSAPFALPKGVEYIRRDGGDVELEILINWNWSPLTIALSEPRFEYISGSSVADSIVIAPRDIAILGNRQ